MLNNFTFQLDADDDSSWLTFYALRDVFRHADPADPEQTFESVRDVLGDMRVIDYSEREGSPWRNRPARHFDRPEHQGTMAGDWKKPLPERSTPPPKDWGAKSKTSDLPRKDWSKLGR